MHFKEHLRHDYKFMVDFNPISFFDGTYFMVDITNYEQKVVRLPHKSNCLMDFF